MVVDGRQRGEHKQGSRAAGSEEQEERRSSTDHSLAQLRLALEQLALRVEQLGALARQLLLARQRARSALLALAQRAPHLLHLRRHLQRGQA